MIDSSGAAMGGVGGDPALLQKVMYYCGRK
jgi:hypothetical protein